MKKKKKKFLVAVRQKLGQKYLSLDVNFCMYQKVIGVVQRYPLFVKHLLEKSKNPKT